MYKVVKYKQNFAQNLQTKLMTGDFSILQDMQTNIIPYSDLKSS